MTQVLLWRISKLRRWNIVYGYTIESRYLLPDQRGYCHLPTELSAARSISFKI